MVGVQKTSISPDNTGKQHIPILSLSPLQELYPYIVINSYTVMILGFKSDLNFYKSVLLLTNIYQKKFLLLLIVGSKKHKRKYDCINVLMSTLFCWNKQNMCQLLRRGVCSNNSLFSPWMKLEPKFANYVYLDKALYISIRNLMFRLLIGLTVLTLESNGHTSMQLI